MKSARSKMQPFLVDSELLRVSYEISFLSKLEELRYLASYNKFNLNKFSEISSETGNLEIR